MEKKSVCVNCHYENIEKRKADQDRGGYYIWCNHYSKYINDDERQGVKPKGDGTYDQDVWCSAFKPY